MVKKFTNKFIPIFTKFKKFENKYDNFTNNSNNQNNSKDIALLFEENEFFLIEVELNARINKNFSKLKSFLKTLKFNIEDLKKLVIDYVALIKGSVEKFLYENKKIYGGNMDLDFEHMQKFYESITKESLEKSFIVSRILGNDDNINKFNEFLNELRNDLIKFKIVKKEIIYTQGNFDISNFQSMEDLIFFVVELIPMENKLSSALLLEKFEFKWDPGVFKSWKKCIILKTLQNNILIYDGMVNKIPDEIFNMKKLKFKIKEEKKFPYKFEITEKKKSFFSSNKVVCIDALNEENLKRFKDSLNIIE